MREERERIGFDASTGEEMTLIVLHWECDKETQDEFLREAIERYPCSDQAIMHRRIEIIERKKVYDYNILPKKKDDIFSDHDYIQSTKKDKKNKRF